MAQNTFKEYCEFVIITVADTHYTEGRLETESESENMGR